MSGSVDVTRIAGNIGALNALNSLSYINQNLALHQTRLATGKRMNYAFEDPAGFNLATTFDVRRQGLEVVLRAMGDSGNLISTMEAGMRKIQDILVKMKSKALEAIGDTIGANERAAVSAQLQDYVAEIDQIVNQTQWNGKVLIGGSSGWGADSLYFLVDPDGGSVAFQFSTAAGGSTGFYSAGLTTVNSGLLGGSIAVSNSAMANAYNAVIEDALNKVRRGVMDIGSFQARLQFKEETLKVQYTNVESAYNRIMNANMAQEQVEASKFAILQQTATAMLAQANVAPQFILSLFQ